MLKTFNKGGIHIPEYKFTAGNPIVELPAPREAVVTFSQHIGAIEWRCFVRLNFHGYRLCYISNDAKRYDTIWCDDRCDNNGNTSVGSLS